MSTPKLHLYGLTNSCSLASHILLQEAGLEYDKTIFLLSDFLKNGGYPDDFVKLNGKAKVPVLRADDEIITEGPAISTYIAKLAPSKNLLGKTPLQTVRCYEWLSYLSFSLHGQAYSMVLRPDRWTDVEDGSLDEHVRAKGVQAIKDCYKYIDSKLEGKKWAVGDDFTAADAYLFVFYRWGSQFVQLPMEQDYPNYARHAAEVSKRAAVQEVLKIEAQIAGN